MPTDVILVRGTGEPWNGPGNLLRNVTRQLDPAKFNAIGDVAYPAAVGPAGGGLLDPSEDTSVAQGVDGLAVLIRQCANPVGLLGYSLGSEVVTRFMEAQAQGRYLDCEVAWSACVANPLRAEGDSIDSDPIGWGINGQHGPFPPGHRHFEAANELDVITSCPPDSPLRTLADGLSAFSFAELGGWTEDLVDRLENRRFQPASLGWWLHPIDTYRLYGIAAQDVLGYLTGVVDPSSAAAEHIGAYLAGGFLDRLADKLNAL